MIRRGPRLAVRGRVGLEATDIPSVLTAAARDLAEAGRVTDAGATARALVEREAVHSTAVGAGVAIPHARTPACREAGLVVMTLAAALDFGAPDGVPVDLVFVMVSPPDDPTEHVGHLARIARLLREPGFADGLRRASGGDELVRALERLEAAA